MLCVTGHERPCRHIGVGGVLPGKRRFRRRRPQHSFEGDPDCNGRFLGELPVVSLPATQARPVSLRSAGGLARENPDSNRFMHQTAYAALQPLVMVLWKRENKNAVPTNSFTRLVPRRVMVASGGRRKPMLTPIVTQLVIEYEWVEYDQIQGQRGQRRLSD